MNAGTKSPSSQLLAQSCSSMSGIKLMITKIDVSCSPLLKKNVRQNFRNVWTKFIFRILFAVIGKI